MDFLKKEYRTAGIQGIPAVLVFWGSSLRFSLRQAGWRRKPVVFLFFRWRETDRRGKRWSAFWSGKPKFAEKSNFLAPIRLFLLTRAVFLCIIPKCTVKKVSLSRTRISHLEGGKFMSEVKVKENESLDSALRRFKRTCARDGIMGEVRKREHYDKPSVKRKKKSEAARKRKFK